MPPTITHRQQQTLPADTNGSADSTPITKPPMSAGWPYPGLVIVFAPQVGDELLTLQVPQRVLQLHQLDEEIVLGIETGRVHGALEIEREPLLDTVHPRALRE